MKGRESALCKVPNVPTLSLLSLFRKQADSFLALKNNLAAWKFVGEREALPNGQAGPNTISVFLKDTRFQIYKSYTTYAFVYREVPCSIAEGAKRKSENIGHESKRLKGIGIGAPDGPISLDDVRSLQRSNTELRQQLESHVLTIEALRSENRVTSARHENELKELKEAVSNSCHDHIEVLQNTLDARQKELDDLNATSIELQNSIKDLNERLNASLQSRADADEIINSQKVTISELEVHLDEERNQRRVDREKAEAGLKFALQKAHLEAQEEIKRQADLYSRQQREQQEFIAKIQEDARESLMTSEKKARLLEAQLQDERIALANNKRKMEALETELRKLRKNLVNEKAAREEAWAKVSSLELEIAAAIRDLSIEKQRFQGAREKIILRETQLRAFYSTTEEISALFAKQQEQLKAMQRTLEDEENYENSLFVVDSIKHTNLNVKVTQHRGNVKESSSASTPRNLHLENRGRAGDDDDDDDARTTNKRDCETGSQVGNTQDLECGDRGFGSDIDGVGTAVLPDFDPADTQRILETESQAALDVLGGPPLKKCCILTGDTMEIDDEEETKSSLPRKTSSRKEETETGTIRTTDLLASEAVGSWAVDTAPSVNGENECDLASHGEADAAACHMLGFDDQAAGSQNNNTCEDREPQAPKAVVAAEAGQRFLGGIGLRDESFGCRN
ncbi:hypothetical protein HPP92_018394 [Vanilla planifolia]|uniref:Uncharacterized protein n=1 Tax=Vanilla planifolia TaxID=51239 RepID=A0A835QBY1_VANPL|nr:hypothetical protein HPP92_018394 [Vanilla planifolia]